ncbi:UBP1-associated proteins 1C-like [Panicum hallii]|uniref:UBP1-associated proteins 1C-like n=1 Tax=Panicum hallii TaxID=206008 RepID=UPI000DF4D92A|nr:UBP1-associated proteins 1C-like [Panicum hallii]
MLVIRDALLSQLQKDRLRQDIIMAELARIERAMALRSAGGERADPVRFPSNEHFVAHSGVAEHGVGADEVHDLKKNDGVAHDGVGLEPEKPAMEDHAGQCFKTCCSTGKMACQENAALDECKMQESSQTMLPNETQPSSIKWSCAICQAKATSEGNLQQHFAGQRHQSKVAALVSRRKNANCQKATPTAEEARNVRQYAAEKPHPTWLCRFCQSNCTCKSDLENHLRGKRHKAKIQALLEECKNTMMDFGSTELKSYPNNVTKDEENPASLWNCSLCQTKWTRQSGLENHLKGKRHQLNFLVLQVEAQQYLSDWRCGICLAKCKSASQFEDHCSGRGHKQKIDALLRGGTNARPSTFQAEKKPPSDGSNIKGGISEETGTQRTMYSCKLCNLHCNSKYTLAEHRRGKKHIEKVEKRMSLSYCEVCNLQCNSEKMFAHHRMGKTHLAKVNGC